MTSEIDIYRTASVLIRVHGEDELGKEPFVTDPIVESLSRGEEVKVEVLFYEVPRPVHHLNVSLAPAESKSES